MVHHVDDRRDKGMKKIAMLALENCMQSSITGPMDILSVASIEWKRLVDDESEDLFIRRLYQIPGRRLLVSTE